MVKPQPIQTYNPSFGILQEYRNTTYGKYMKGNYKGHKIEVFDAMDKYNQKLIYISNNRTLKWIISKLIYIQNGIKKINRSSAL